MLQSSVSVSEVEHAMRRMSNALGLAGCDISITLDTITMCAWEGDEPCTLVRVVELREPKLDRLVSIDALSRRIASGGVGLDDAYREANAIAEAPSRYGAGITLAAAAVSASGWIIFAGGGVGGAVAGVIATVIITHVSLFWQRVELTGVFSTAIAAAIVVAVPHGLALAGLHMNLSAAVAGGLYPLLPGGALVAAVSDGMLGSPLSSVAKTLQAVLQALALAVGALATLAAIMALGFSPQQQPLDTSEYVRTLAAGVAIAALAIVRGVAVPTSALAAALAMLAWMVPSLTATRSWSRALAVFAAAAVIGFGGQLLARLLRTTASVFTTSAVYVLVPGMTIYGAMVAFAQDDAALGGQLVANALRVAFAIAAGIASGVLAARSLRFRH